MRQRSGKECEAKEGDVFGSVKYEGRWFVTANGCPVGAPVAPKTAKLIAKWLEQAWPEINPGKA